MCVSGQFCRKNFASAQEVICEQYFRPSHLNWARGPEVRASVADGVVIAGGGLLGANGITAGELAAPGAAYL